MFTGDKEADASDDEVFDCCVNKYTSSSKYTNHFYDWLVDSGLTVHITSRHEAFDTYKDISYTLVLGVGGIQMFTVRRGTVYLLSECDGQVHTLQLNNILHVPSNQNNLLALGHWEDEAGQKVIFDYGKVILSMRDGTVIAKGMKIRNKLYCISFKLAPNPGSEVVCFSANVSSIPLENMAPMLWTCWVLRLAKLIVSRSS